MLRTIVSTLCLAVFLVAGATPAMSDKCGTAYYEGTGKDGEAEAARVKSQCDSTSGDNWCVAVLQALRPSLGECARCCHDWSGSPDKFSGLNCSKPQGHTWVCTFKARPL